MTQSSTDIIILAPQNVGLYHIGSRAGQCWPTTWTDYGTTVCNFVQSGMVTSAAVVVGQKLKDISDSTVSSSIITANNEWRFTEKKDSNFEIFNLFPYGTVT